MDFPVEQSLVVEHALFVNVMLRLPYNIQYV